ncbi:hypothetical protein [Paraburkholderia caledonica]|jgi:hypothetical protein|uniref:hypothetical protein n=1 Tax=Paraburkholderia caledonica TaxID=134536 RepID=UPI000483C893|nr:hypothetical protein [Paraburkholderia caledonica]
MTTLSSLNLAATLAPTPLTDSVNPAVAVDGDARRMVALSPSAIVTIPSTSSITVLQTYTPKGTLSAAMPTVSWASDNRDAVTLRMAGNYAAQTMAGRFAGLGSALLDRFKAMGSDYSQSVSVGSAGVGGIGRSSQQPAGQIGLTVRTASGVTVEIALGSEDGGLSVSIKSSGALSESERNALAKLSEGFQQAIDGLGAVPPKLDLSGLTQSDTSVLASVSFQYNTTGAGNADISARYSQDSAARSLSVTSAAGAMSVKVDTSDSALWGTGSQRAASVASYLRQFDHANSRGHGNATLMSMFEDGFAQMNESYGTPSAEALPGTAYAPRLQQSVHAMLTGLADFSASITDASASPNPMRPGEVDAFSYQVSQTTQLEGSRSEGKISQNQQSHLIASYHQALTDGGKPVLTSSKSSQNYDYVLIDDSAESAVQLATERGALVHASLRQTSDRSTRHLKYERGVLTSDLTTPEDTSRSTDLLSLLEPLIDKGDAARNSAGWQQALSRVHRMILLNASK